MDDRIMQFRVGAVVLGVVLIAGVMTALFGHFPGSHYTINVDLANAPGVAVDTPVKFSGVLIGRVRRVVIDQSDPKTPVHLTVEIESQYHIRHDQTIQLGSNLLGDAELDVISVPQSATPETAPTSQTTYSNYPPADQAPSLGGAGQTANPPAPATPPESGVPAPKPAQLPAAPPSSTYVQPGETIRGISGGSTTEQFAKLETDMSKVSDSLSAASDEVRKLAHNLNGMLGNGDSERLRRLMDRTEGAMTSMQRTLDHVDTIVGDPKMQADMKNSLASLPSTLNQMQQSFASIQHTTALADENLKNLQGFTRPLNDQGGEMITHANSSIRELDELLAQLARFSATLNGSQGTLGQLINSPELYQQLNEAAANINDLTRRLRPILGDVRDFTDKIARHPEVLGVRGAIERSPGIK
jgi:phospholipid/cholesterol/gamma-HCH transport system substrate-binding protein